MNGSSPGVQYDDANLAAAARFRENALAAGHAVAMPDGTVVRPTPHLAVVTSPPPPLPAYIELDEAGDEHTIAVKRRNGTVIELHASIRYGAAREFEKLQDEVTRMREAYTAATDRAERTRLAGESLRLEEDIMRLLFDNLPDGLLGDLHPLTVRKLSDYFGQMLMEATGAADTNDPNA